MHRMICLNMIVKDEAHVIRRCLESVRPFIDYWVIVDTGSSDGTQDVIRAALAGVPGELHERPWRDFGHNRTEALQLARAQGDYLLFIDADESLRAPQGFAWPQLANDAYYLSAEYGSMAYSRCALISTRLEWRWTGVLHECLVSASAAGEFGRMDWPRIVVQHDGARARDPKTYQKDAATLERALIEEPGNARYAFYLAQSWRDAGEWAKAREAYHRRAAMNGWEEETWHALYEVAKLTERLNGTAAEVRSAYLDAWQRRPSRAEPLYQLARYHRERNELWLAYLFSKQAVVIARPADLLFIDEGVYNWCSLDEYAIASYWTSEYAESEKASRTLLVGNHLPAQHRPRVMDNLNWALRKQGLPDWVPVPAERSVSVEHSSSDTVRPACPVCSAAAAHCYGGSPYWICPDCDAWFQHPAPPKLYHGPHEPPPQSMSLAEQEANRTLARLLFTNVMGSRPGPVMDIGAKLPVLAAELQRLGCTALAMDGAPGAQPLGELLDVAIIGADFEAWNPDAHLGQFRLITLIHCFEHFYDPVAALRKLRRLIAPDGALFIRLPDHGVPGFERDLTPGHYTIHPFFHTLASLRRALAAAGEPFAIAETYPLAPGQRDLILRPAALPSAAAGQEPTLPRSGAAAPLPVIALHRPGAIGDILMTLNLIPALRRQYPGHRIHYFCHPSYAGPEALGGLLAEAGVDEVLDATLFDARAPRCARSIRLVGYPLADGYPERPMTRHLIEYFAAEMTLTFTPLPALMPKLPPRPTDAPKLPYATLQTAAGWSKYKEWPRERWEQVRSELEFPVVVLGEQQGRSLAHSIALVANARLHIGIDSFANHLTHYQWQDDAGQARRVPGVILFGSTQASASGYPGNINLTTRLPCQPCFREDPAPSRQPRGPCVNPPRSSYADDTPPACMARIDVAQVTAAIRRAWAAGPAGPGEAVDGMT